MRAKELMMKKINAFELYQREGKIDTVTKRYPDLVSFIEINRHKSMEQIKEELLKELYVSA